MSRGQKNSLAKMMQCSPCCRKWNQLWLGPKANPYVSTWLCSKLPASLRGRQGIRWGLFLSPRFWSASGGRIFPTPGQQEGFSPSRFYFFHSFPHQGGGENLGFRIKTNYFQLLLPIAYRLQPIAHSLIFTCCINNSLFHKGCVFFNTKGRGNKGPKNIKSPALGQPRLFRNHIFIVA